MKRQLALSIVGSDRAAVPEEILIQLKRRFSLLVISLALVVSATVSGQTELDSFDPNLNGPIYPNEILVQPDGKILVAGDFTTVSPNGGAEVIRNRIARFNPDGTLDQAFNPDANNTILAIALQPDGKILVGGWFTSIGGQARNRIARLNPDGSADSFNPNPTPDHFVRLIVVQPDGKILVAGEFTNIGGQPRNGIARLDPVTGLADSFHPNSNTSVYAMALQPDGKILVGGAFEIIGGQPRNHVARLDPVTGMADAFEPSANYFVNAIAVQQGGKILVGGQFTVIGGQPRNRIAGLDPETGFADAFNPNSNCDVRSIVVQPDGKILVGGCFTQIGGQPRNRIARLDPVTSLADAFRADTNDSVNTVAVQPDGKILMGGYFITVRPNGGSPVIRNRIARLSFTEPTPKPTQVVSRKQHNGLPFDLNLPLTGNSGVECRSGGATNDYEVVFSFPSAVTFTDASVTTGAGSVTATSGNGTPVVTVNLTGVANAQRMTVMLAGVNNRTATGDVAVQMSVLIGDANGDGTVNSGDAQQTRNRSGQSAAAVTFRSDFNVDGTINSGDAFIVRSRSGTSLP